jgi:hypothetical protein
VFEEVEELGPPLVGELEPSLASVPPLEDTVAEDELTVEEPFEPLAVEPLIEPLPVLTPLESPPPVVELPPEPDDEAPLPVVFAATSRAAPSSGASALLPQAAAQMRLTPTIAVPPCMSLIVDFAPLLTQHEGIAALHLVLEQA